MTRSIVDIWLEKAEEAEKIGDLKRRDFCLKKAEEADSVYERIEKKKEREPNG